MKRIFLTIAGVALILVGIAGLFLPILQGWLFIFLGLSLISPALARRLRRKLLGRLFRENVILLKDWKKYSVRLGFTTRHFPLLLHKTEDLNEPANQEKLKALLPQCSKFVFLNQVHGNQVVVIPAPAKNRGGSALLCSGKAGIRVDSRLRGNDVMRESEEIFLRLKETDAVITSQKGLTLLALTADCLSIFLLAPNGWVGLVHAGWRGTQKGIAAKAFKLIVEKSNCHPREVRAIFGPSIGKDHYEVGPEFQTIFSKKSLAVKKGKIYFDLPEENRRQLISAGALEKNIKTLRICTVCENEDFYSFRQEGNNAGRMISFIQSPFH